MTYDAKAKAPRFRAFLREITGGSKELADFFQLIIGYALTGSTSSQCLFFFYGTGANGKTTLLGVLQKLLGNDLALQTPPDTFAHKPHGRSASNDLARLRAARVVESTEIDEGSFLNESLVKQLTGGDRIAARFMYKEFFEFVPKFKLFIAGNHKPIIRGTDVGMWRRIVLVPFTRTIPPERRDRDLPSKLEAELPGILNFAIGGCLRWQRVGLVPPKAVTVAVDAYKEEMDTLGRWITDVCATTPGSRGPSSKLYLSYQAWAQCEGHRPMSHSTFSRKLAERFDKVRSARGYEFRGIGLRTDQKKGV